MTESTLQHQKKQLAAIKTLICETTTEESALHIRIKSNRIAAEEKRTNAIAACLETAAARKIESERVKTKVLAKVEKRRLLEPEILKEKHEQRIIEINTNAEEISEKIEAKLNEATWLSESVYEGAFPKPRERTQKLQETFHETQEKLNALVEEAPKTLSRLRQSLTVETVDEDSNPKLPMAEYVTNAEKALQAIQSNPNARWFVGIRPIFIVVIVALATVTGIGAYTQWEIAYPIFLYPLIAMAIAIGALVMTYYTGMSSVRKNFVEFRENVALAERTFAVSMQTIEQKRRSEEKRITTTRDVEIKKAEQKYKPRLDDIDRLLRKDLDKEEERFRAVAETLTAKLEQDALDANNTFDATMQQIEKDEHENLETIQAKFDETTASINNDEQETNKKLIHRWRQEFDEFYDDVQKQITNTTNDHPAWDTNWSDWTPRTEACGQIPVGTLQVDLTSIAGDLPSGKALQLQGDETISLPLSAMMPRDASILISSSSKHRQGSIALLQNAILRVLTAVPPGKAKFTLIDPVGLGQSFAGVLHLADYEESQLLDRAWTEPRHIETQLARLTEHMETVIQKYLRNEFDSIDAYNEQAGEIAEPYRFLVVADLPNNFSENASKRLSSIITSGARCGVYVIIHRDVSLPLPAGIDDDTLRRIPLRIKEENDIFRVDEDVLCDLPLQLDTPPHENTTTTIVKRVGETADNTHRVEVPFNIIAPSDEDIWSLSTVHKLAIPLGRSGATKLQNLTLGRGTAQHALIAGKTGSGKSTLLHVLITNLALWYSPDEVEFYLVDFKKGVEFKTYATHTLPHARVVAVESDREFGISVLQRIDAELKRRGELFRDLGVQDITGYREKETNTPMPRILLIIDEFQEFFIDDDRVAQEANLLLDRLVRQGRAFGIHAIMGSQTLDGAYTISRSTMGQMAVRIALQCSEQDSYIILNEDNAAARLLSRPGEAIYNDAAGNVEGNSPFQIVWLDDKLREGMLQDLANRDKHNTRSLVVYEGNQPVFLQQNQAFQSASHDGKPLSAKAWLGGAMAIEEDTSATFRAASASNLLIVGQQDETTTSMVASALLSLDKQHAENDASFVILDGTPSDASHAQLLKEIVQDTRCQSRLVGLREIEEAMQSMHAELQARMTGGAANAPSMFFVVNALHKFRDLRRDEDDYGFSAGGEDKPMTPAQVLAELLKEGPTLGMHVIVATDTLANLNRTFDRQSLREFDMRVLLQMGANDSTNLIDMPDASRLGMHRALLYSEETGTIEPFRPYALPEIRKGVPS